MKKPTSPSPQQDAQATPFYCAKDYRPEDSIAYLIRQILDAVAQEVEKQLAHTELTNAQWIPLFKLYMGKASTVAELARECRLDAGAMTRTLDRLEAKGLCQRARSEVDRRVVNITLTEAGTEAARDIPKILSRVQNANLAGFSTEEFETLKSYLHRILNNTRATNAPHDTPTPTNTGHNNAE
jgi:DNA-binding MarR family transcriptional regulator